MRATVPPTVNVFRNSMLSRIPIGINPATPLVGNEALPCAKTDSHETRRKPGNRMYGHFGCL